VLDAINDAGKQTLSASMQKILINYLQVAALFNAFPLRWPAEVELLFEAQGAVSTVGEHLVNPDCVRTTQTAAEWYYSKQQFFAALPFIVVAASFVIWYIYGRIKNRPFFDKETTETNLTTKDKFVVNITTVLYLLYPTLCKNTFGLFDCKIIGGQAYLKVDLEEKCYQGRHQTMMVLLGVGQLVVYVIGLPLVVLVFLRRNHDSLRTHVSQARYGLFYGGYKTDRFFWSGMQSTMPANKLCRPRFKKSY
jgi:NADH:ubiquinone oxidoreductase subunit 5 (subunit L)/multisubunit Na+/H+ antiporter MnhA subunit